MRFNSIIVRIRFIYDEEQFSRNNYGDKFEEWAPGHNSAYGPKRNYVLNARAKYDEVFDSCMAKAN